MRRLICVFGFVIGAWAPVGCNNECGDDEKVCDGDGERCYCSVQCSSHADCESGQRCWTEKSLCIYLTPGAGNGYCGTQGMPCCTIEGSENCEWGMSCIAGTCTPEDGASTGTSTAPGGDLGSGVSDTCARPCTPGATLCDGAEVCFEGYCVPSECQTCELLPNYDVFDACEFDTDTCTFQRCYP